MSWRDAFFNELSLWPSPHVPDDAVLDRFISVVLASCGRVRIAADALYGGWTREHSLHSYADSQSRTRLEEDKPDTKGKRERGRALLHIFDGRLIVSENPWLYESVGKFTPAYGADSARTAEGLAFSLASSNDWMGDHLHLISPDRAQKARVPHVATLENLRTYQSLRVTELEPRDSLRLALTLEAPLVFLPAAKYSAKHVAGASNSDRAKRAENGGPGQYLVHLEDDTRVTDALISDWERAVLEAGARNDGDIETIVMRHNSGFHVFGKLSHQVGFNGGTGEPTQWLRVELTSSRTVHSHPRTPG